MKTTNTVSGISKFLFSTLVAAAAMTSTAWAEGTTVTVSSADEINGAINALNTGGTLDLGEVAYEYKATLTSDDDMATIDGAGTYTIKGGKGALLNYELEVNPNKLDGTYTVNVLEDSHLTFTKLTLRDSVDMTVAGARLDSNIYQGGASYLSVYRDSSLTVSNSTIGYNPKQTGVADPATFLKETTPSADNQGYWNWGIRLVVCGNASIENSNLFLYVGQGSDTSSVRGSGEMTVKSSNVSFGSLTIGYGEDDKKYLNPADLNEDGSIKDGLLATLILNNSVAKNTQYIGDQASLYSGINLGNAEGTFAGKLLVENNSVLDLTALRYGSREIGIQINNARSSVSVVGSVLKTSKLTNKGTFSVSGNSSLNIGTVSGNAVQVVGDTTLTDSTIGGTISVGYDKENESDTTLTLVGETDIGNLYVGKEGRENNYKLVVSGNDAVADVHNLYNRTDSEVTVSEGATLNIDGYWQSKGTVTADDATINVSSVNMYVYNNDSTDAATISLKNGATLTSTGAYAIYLGNSEGGPAKGNASISLEGGSKLDTYNLTLHATGTVEEVAGAEAKTSLSSTDSTVIVQNALTVGAGATVSLNNSTLTAGTLTNNGSIAVSGNSAIDAKISGEGLLQITDGTLTLDKGVETERFIVGKSGYLTTEVDAGTDTTITVTGENKITGTADTATWVGLADNTDWSAGNKGKFVLNITGKDTKWDGGSTHIANAGQLNIKDGAYAELTYTKVRGGLTVDASTVDIKSQMNVYGEENYADGDPSDKSDVLLSNADFKVLNGSSVAVTGSLTVGKDSNANRVGTVTVDGKGSSLTATGKVSVYSGSAVKVNEGATLTANGGLAYFGTVSVSIKDECVSSEGNRSVTVNIYDSEGVLVYEKTNVTLEKGKAEISINPDALVDGEYTVAVVDSDGNILTAENCTQKIKNGSLEVGANSTLTANVITGKGNVVLAGTINVAESLSAGNLTIVEGAMLNIGSSEGVALMAEVSAIEFDTLTIIATDVKVGEGLDLSSIITGTGSDEFWSALGDGTEFTVVDSETNISYTGVYSTANGGSVSIVPEPSAFGLLAGLGAIALAVSRRRRNCR